VRAAARNDDSVAIAPIFDLGRLRLRLEQDVPAAGDQLVCASFHVGQLLGRYIGRNVYVEFATDAQGYTATSIEIGLTRSLSLLSSVATLGGTSASVRWKRDY